jgi:hypothetical protein
MNRRTNRSIPVIAFLVLFFMATRAAAQPAPMEGLEILSRAADAAGGEIWQQVETLQFDGTISYYTRSNSVPRTVARYQMWRDFHRSADSNLPSDGLVRVRVSTENEVIVDTSNASQSASVGVEDVAPDSDTSFWNNAFAIELIRVVLNNEQFQVARMPDGNIENIPVFNIRIISPSGQESVVSVDSDTFMIRGLGALQNGGWRQRIYGDFRNVSETGYMQPYSISLYANGSLAAHVDLHEVQINTPIDPQVFVVTP